MRTVKTYTHDELYPKGCMLDYNPYTWLREFLTGGAQGAKAVFRECVEAGFTEKQIRTAAKHLGIHPRKYGFGKDGCWIL